MPSYLKNNTNYGYYLIESDSTNNDDWITDHAGDPGELDLALYTEGLEYIYISKIDTHTDSEEYARMVEDFIDGEAIEQTIGQERNIYTVRGTINSTASPPTIVDLYTQIAKVKKFCRYHNRDDEKQAYLVNRIGATDYELFYKGDKTEVKYLKGFVRRRDLIYNEGDLYFNVVIPWRVVWGT